MTNKICKRCAKYKAFKDKCRFYWPGKKKCTHFGITLEDDSYIEQPDEVESLIKFAQDNRVS